MNGTAEFHLSKTRINALIEKGRLTPEELEEIERGLRLNSETGTYFLKNYRERSSLAFGANTYRLWKEPSLINSIMRNANDLTLIILILLSVVSLVFSISLKFLFKEEEFSYESIFILAAILIIIIAGGLNEYYQDILSKNLIEGNKEVTVKILKEGTFDTKNRRKLVVGDILILEPGDEIPCDALLLSKNTLNLKESMITGESKNITKNHLEILLAGSYILGPSARALILRTGMESTKGKIIKTLERKHFRTPLENKSKILALELSNIAFLISLAIVFSKIVYFYKELSFLRIIYFVMEGISIAAVIIPEGLPITISLALCTAKKQLLNNRIRVKFGRSIELMETVNILCIDKTGTLTENRLDWKRSYPKIINNELKINAILNNSAFRNSKNELIGVEIETALLKNFSIAEVEGLREDFLIIDRQEFSSAKKMMGTTVKDRKTGKIYELIKGAPEKIEVLYPEEAKKFIKKSNGALLRTIAFAYKEINTNTNTNNNNNTNTIKNNSNNTNNNTSNNNINTNTKIITDYIFSGLISFDDPIRKNVLKTLSRIKEEGIKTIIITGDSLGMANRMARRVRAIESEDIPHFSMGNRETPSERFSYINTFNSTKELSMDGEELSKLSDYEILRLSSKLSVVARARPSDKARLVNTLQKSPMYNVAFIGDGTNDAPALAGAAVSFSFAKSGTDIAKGTAKIIVEDGGIDGILNIRQWSKTINRSIRQFVEFQLSSAFSLIAILLVSLIAGMKLFDPILLLIFNLYLDAFAAIGYGTEHPTNFMKNEEELNKSLVTEKIKRNILYNILISSTLCTLAIILGRSRAFIFNIFIFISISFQVSSRFRKNRNRLTNIFKNPVFIFINAVFIILIISGTQYFNSVFDGGCSLKEWGVIFTSGLLAASIRYFL